MVEEADQGIFAHGRSDKQEDVISLETPVSNSGIKEALWGIGDNKSPGPDGYSSQFFKATWDTTGPEVCAAVKEFFNNVKMLGKINNTVISLIAKIESPMMVEQFRPIACCNVIYKVISKVMTNRMSKSLT